MNSNPKIQCASVDDKSSDLVSSNEASPYTIDLKGIPGAILYRHQYKYIKKRRENDAEFKEKESLQQMERHKKKIVEDPKYREQVNKWSRDAARRRYHEDPEYRAKVLARNKSERDKKRALLADQKIETQK
jgi:hypothetical protein